MLKTQSSPDRFAPALVSLLNGGDNVNLTALIDGLDDWPAPVNVPSFHPAWLYTEVDKGTGVGEWQESSVPGAIADGLVAVPSAGTAASRTLNTTWTPSADHGGRPVRVSVSGTLACTSTLVLAQTAAVELRSDTATTPTTKRADATFTLGGVAASATVPFSVTYDVPAGHRVRLVTSGAGTVAITSVNETAL